MKPRIRIRDGVVISEVRGLHEPNPEVIKHIEILLGYAKTGELRSIMEICEWSDGVVGSGWRVSRHYQKRNMVGEMMRLVSQFSFEDTTHAKIIYGPEEPNSG